MLAACGGTYVRTPEVGATPLTGLARAEYDHGAASAPPVQPLVGLGDRSGLGWPGPRVVRQRYDIEE